MTTQPIYASLSRIKDEEVRTAIRLIADALERAGTRIVSAEQRPAIPATAIRQNLQITGATPLNLVGLPGLPTVEIGVQKAGALIGTEPTINVIDGANITITVADDPGNSRVNLTIASAVALAVQKAGALIGTRPIINFTEDGNVVLTIADNPGATRIDIGVQAIPGGGIAPFTTLFEWLPYSYNAVPNPSWANDLSLSYTGAGAYTLFTDAAATNALQLGPNLTAAVFSNANPLQLAVNEHGLSTGDQIYITGCIDNGVSPPGNWSALNGLWTVTKVNANLFTVPFDSRFINGLHANQVASYFGYNNWPSFNNATGQVEHSPCATFMNPKGSAANVFLLTFGGTVASGAGRLLYFVVDYLPYTTGGDASGIVVGTELNHYRFVIGATPAVTVYKRIAGVDYQQCAAVAVSATGHGWQRVGILVNTTGARVGNYRDGAVALWINGLPVFKSHMNAAEPTLPLGAAVSISLRMPGSANARTNYVYCSRVAAYSVPPEFEQFIS